MGQRQRQVKQPVIRPIATPRRPSSLIPSSSVPSSTLASTSVSYSAPPSSSVPLSAPLFVPPVSVPARPIAPVRSARPTQPSLRPIAPFPTRFLSRWPQPMDLDPSGIIQRSHNLPPNPPSRWPEPMDLDPPGLMNFTPLDLKFDLSR